MSGTSSPALRTSFRKGRNAALRGLPKTANPSLARFEVDAIEELHGWARVHAMEWDKGWESGMGDRPTLVER